VTKSVALIYDIDGQGPGATTGGRRSGPPSPQKKNWTDHPNFFDEECISLCDYRYVTDYSPRNWVYHPYFVLYNNLDQGIGTPNLENVVAPMLTVIKFVCSNMEIDNLTNYNIIFIVL